MIGPALLGLAFAAVPARVTDAKPSSQGQSGSVRGLVLDKDFDAPLAGAQVLIVETGQKLATNDQGNYVFPELPPGKYTLVFSKDGYVRAIKGDVLVVAGQLTDVDVQLSGEFTEMEEFVVQDVLAIDTGTEAGLLELRFETPAMMDSISAGLMSRAGANDAAGALRLVAGATVQNGKFAVIRGLPDRYVSSQMNGVRLPSADEDKRAVELDQFPTAVIDSIQVSKTFTPDQQGDASGGAVDVRLKGVPDEGTLLFSAQLGSNSNVTLRDGFLTYDGGGVNFLGTDDGGRDVQTGNLGSNWDGAVGVSERAGPIKTKWTLSGGDKLELDNGWKLGAFGSLFWERDAQMVRDGTNDSLWVDNPGEAMSPVYLQGAPQPGTPVNGDFKTALFDIRKGTQIVRWGALGSFGLENENNKLGLTFLHTHVAEDSATLATDTRGKEYYFPGYDPNDPSDPGNSPGGLNAAPYIRTETLVYTERDTDTLQLRGDHKLPFDFGGDSSWLGTPELDWTLSASSAALDQPDKRQFGAIWLPESLNPGAPPFIPPFTTPETWLPFKPAANFNLGNLQRIWKTIDEDSEQLSVNMKVPFQQWSGLEGYFKTGLFSDSVRRDFNQDTFSNFGDGGASYQGGWDEPWSSTFPSENHPITASNEDINYKGKQDITAGYGMVDMPIDEQFKLVGGARVEQTKIAIENKPEGNAFWFPPGATAPVQLNPGDADVDFSQDNLLPSLAAEYRPVEQLTVRASYSHTIARQTFKELTPIIQQEFVGGPVFIGNPDLQMSSLDNYDVRFDYTPYEGGLVSLSVFHKDIEDPIEYVQRLAGFVFTTPVNYPKGRLGGVELELRQDLGRWTEELGGLSAGFNATFIESSVELSAFDQAQFSLPEISAPTRSRDMTNAPEYLFNLFLTYDLEKLGTQFGVFYTIQGDTLIAGAGQAQGNYVPDVYARQYDTLNFSVFQKLGEHLRLQLQAKNLTDPSIDTVYRSKYIGDDVRRSSFTRGIDVSLTLNLSYSF